MVTISYHLLTVCLSLSPPTNGVISYSDIQHWAMVLWPPSHVALATLSMETPPGLVGVMECGVGSLQLVSVSGMNFVLFVC